MNTPDGISVDINYQLKPGEGSDEIVEEETSGEFGRLKHLTNWPPVDIQFQDITQTVPDVTCGKLMEIITPNGTTNSDECCWSCVAEGRGVSRWTLWPLWIHRIGNGNAWGSVWVIASLSRILKCWRRSRSNRQKDDYCYYFERLWT